MTGGGAAAAPNVMYDLAAPRNFPRLDQTVDAQLVVNDPAAVLLFDTQKVLVRPNAPDDPTFETARWSDSLPKLSRPRSSRPSRTRNTSAPCRGRRTEPTRTISC